MRVPRATAGRRCTRSSRASTRCTAARLAPYDAQRIQRALEVHALTGTPLSALQGARDVADEDIGPLIVVALAPADRAALHAAIAHRFDAMLDAGLVDESATSCASRYAIDARDAVDALRRLPPGVGVSRRANRSRRAARARHRRDAPAREAPAHVAARHGRRRRSTCFARATSSRRSWRAVGRRDCRRSAPHAASALNAT